VFKTSKGRINEGCGAARGPTCNGTPRFSGPDKPFLDFRRWPLAGVTAPDKYTVRFRIKGKYPQWKYWLAMTFSSPVP